MIKNDLSNQSFGLWVVQSHWEKLHGKTYWRCQCLSCGAERMIEAYQLKKGLASQCKACVPKPNTRSTHGMAKSPEYRAYQAARTRCTNPRQRYYGYWGGRGIEFRFTSFEQFYAYLGPKPSCIHTLDRIDNNGHYEPGNVRWVTLDVQAKNKRPYRKRSQNKSFQFA